MTQKITLIVRDKNKRGKKFGDKSKVNGSKVKRNDGVQCFDCYEFGHIRKYCPHRKKNDEKEHDDSDKYVSNENIPTISKSNNIFSRDGWILYYGCVSHVCFTLDYFDTFQRKKSGFVFFGDGSTCALE